ncbi:hypothetical protein GNI_219720 [Gregarina niphandrodes]|uniref:Uncharacterized protein n=1 Tax=Gregarina niphandrodes TaxID=110365 RepID=A0A023AVM3_GRENI|nr:hypothetical protein GNI_219720 [Gregarina niphandrodes]EZG42829.1 hypothetical protein GNI_219720 [Gregarina niphandrodes]|eukprot:XP_011133892.1 hypothetical protein GNI_219720 [Gregarina niphandrodes]
MSKSIPKPATHNYSNTNEAQGGYAILKKHLAQIKDYCRTLRKPLLIFTDNALLNTALNKPEPDDKGDVYYFANKILRLLKTVDNKVTYYHIHGKFNPADAPNRQPTDKLKIDKKRYTSENRLWANDRFYRTQESSRTPTANYISRPQLLTQELINTRKRPPDHDLLFTGRRRLQHETVNI